MKLRAIEWYEEERVLGVKVRAYKWRIQMEVDGQWESLPLVDLGARQVGFDPDFLSEEDIK